MPGMHVSLIGQTTTVDRAALERRWTRVATHTHHVRTGQVPQDEANRTLIGWCQGHGIGAVGLGSPWEPVSSRHYRECEGPLRDRYYAGLIDPKSVTGESEVRALLASLTHQSRGTSFYIDNETPKCRNGHIWWFGWNFTHPAWHDYSQDRPVALWDGDPDGTDPNPLTGRPHRRRSYFTIVGEQRRLGALAVWAHPTSWWTQGEDAQFVTNIASEAGLHLLSDGRLDGLAVVGYDSCHRAYQRLWFHLLDQGADIPGFAETDACFDRGASHQPTNHHTLLPLDGQTDPERITTAARTGAAIAGSGPMAILSVDGVAMGGTVTGARDSGHQVELTVVPAPGQDTLARVELIGPGGKVVWRQDASPASTFRLGLTLDEAPAWLVARVFGAGDDPEAASQKAIAHCAVSNPVYLRERGWSFRPVLTDYRLSIASDSRWRGGQVCFASADGRELERIPLTGDPVRRDLAASTRITLLGADGERAESHIGYDSPVVVELMRYLWQGRFRNDHRALAPGEVPPACFRLGELRAALERIERRI